MSIHCDSATNNTVTGMETYHYPGNVQGNALNKAVHTYAVPVLGRADRGIKIANFAVLRETDMPACLVEMAFISNPAEEDLQGSASFQETAATTIVQSQLPGCGV